MIKYLRLNLTPYMQCAVEVLSLKWGICGADIFRQALKEKIDRDLSEDDKESIEELLNEYFVKPFNDR